MGWEKITCAKCGKEDRVQIGGKVADRERKAKWMTENGWACDDCKKAATEATKAEREAKGAENKYGLAGSEKQIAWATDILDAISKVFANDPAMRPAARENADQIAQFFAEYINDAKTWIDRRDYATSKKVVEFWGLITSLIPADKKAEAIEKLKKLM